LIGCPSIDVFAVDALQKERPSVIFHYNGKAEPYVVEKALDAAASAMRNRDVERFYYFLGDTMHKVSERRPIEASVEEVQSHYTRMLSRLDLGPDQINVADWMRCDQVIQAYINLSRTAWAIRKELAWSGFFGDPDGEIQGKTVQEILEFLEDPDHVKRVKHFDFEYLGITDFPPFILERDWPGFVSISLEETAIERTPQKLLDQKRKNEAKVEK
jgi:hypothetical protein